MNWGSCYAANGSDRSGNRYAVEDLWQTSMRRPNRLPGRRVSAPWGPWKVPCAAPANRRVSPDLPTPRRPEGRSPARPADRTEPVPAVLPGAPVGRPPSPGRDRWLTRSVAVVAALVGAAAIALLVSRDRQPSSVDPDRHPFGPHDSRTDRVAFDQPPIRRSRPEGRFDRSSFILVDDLHLHDGRRRPQRPSGDLVVEPLERLGGPEHHDLRSELLEQRRARCGHVQRASRSDQLPRPEHLHRDRSPVDRSFGPGCGDHGRRSLERSDLQLRLSIPEQLDDIDVRSR